MTTNPHIPNSGGVRSAKRQTKQKVGLVGLGLMGRGIATCLLGRGFNVIAFNRTSSRARQARAFIDEQMQDMVRRKVIRPSVAKDWRARFRVAKACAGPFRWMDLTGIEAYGLVMQELLPELCNETRLPEIMQKMMRDGAQGTRTESGFYAYTAESAKAWEETWIEFTYDIRRLVKKHETRLRKANALDDQEC